MTTRKSSCNCGQLSVSYEGPDSERISLCQCYECQKRTCGRRSPISAEASRALLEQQKEPHWFPSAQAAPSRHAPAGLLPARNRESILGKPFARSSRGRSDCRCIVEPQ
jgi:hypothetical protein